MGGHRHDRSHSVPVINMFATISPHGQVLGLTSDAEGLQNLYNMTLTTGEQIRLTNLTGNNVHSAFSSDGEKIAFGSDRTSTFEIFAMDFDGTNQIQLTFDGLYAPHPSFSPDEQQIVFHAVKRAGSSALATVPVTCGQVTYLTSFDGSHVHAAWIAVTPK